MSGVERVLMWLGVACANLTAASFITLFLSLSPVKAQTAATDLLGNPLPTTATTSQDTPASGEQNANAASRSAQPAPAGAVSQVQSLGSPGLIQPLPPQNAAGSPAPAGPIRPEPSGPLENTFESFGQFNRASDLARSRPGTYDPLGIKFGQFLLLPQISAETLFTDNVRSSGTNTISDTAAVFRPRLRLRSQWQVHAFEVDVSSSHSRFRRVKTQNGDSYTARLRGRLDISRRTNISARARYSTQQEDQSSNDTPTNIAELANDRTYTASLALNHRFNRLSFSLRGAATKRDFDDVALQDGTIQNNDDRDATQTRLGLRLLYEVTPAFSIFTESEVNKRKTDDIVDDNGLRRSGEGYLAAAGFLAEFGPKLTAELRVGYTRQMLDDPTLVDVKGLIFDANLLWRPTSMTSVVLLARSQVDDTTLSTSSGSLDRTYTARVRHAFRPNINLSGELEYETEDFAGSNLQDRTLTATAAAEYLLNRNVALTSQYRFVRNTSSDNTGEFDRNELRIGVRLQR